MPSDPHKGPKNLSPRRMPVFWAKRISLFHTYRVDSSAFPIMAFGILSSAHYLSKFSDSVSEGNS